MKSKWILPAVASLCLISVIVMISTLSRKQNKDAVFTPPPLADVYFTNCEGFSVWLKLRILDESGEILGETGLIKPGEYVKSVTLTSHVTDGQKIKLKIMAYEPDTYYSAGTAVLNTMITKGDAE